ncbi:MAG TPA: hypothetical protein VLE23_08890 [Geminicoccaceae bacterium]|nr:hypothetical protein [Geminicoccaceae bacterium]
MGGKNDRPRFERFAAAMAQARANEAPVLGLYEDGPATEGERAATYAYPPTAYADRPAYDDEPAAFADEPAAYADRPTAYNGQPAEYGDRPAYYHNRPAYPDDAVGYPDRPAEYDDEPPPYHDRWAAYDGLPAGVSSSAARPALRPVVPRPRRARGRAALRWLGVAGCVLIVCVLIASWLTWPETARLFDRWLAGEWAEVQAVIPAPSPDPMAAAKG